MREPRHRFSDGVRSATRAAALRMVHAGTVAESPEALAAWIARTDDLRAELTNGGYGTAFTADDLFPLFEAAVARATAAAPAPPQAQRPKWLWIGVIIVVIAIVAAIIAAV